MYLFLSSSFFLFFPYRLEPSVFHLLDWKDLTHRLSLKRKNWGRCSSSGVSSSSSLSAQHLFLLFQGGFYLCLVRKCASSKAKRKKSGGDMTRNIFSSQLAQHHSNIRKKKWFFQPFSSFPHFLYDPFFFFSFFLSFSFSVLALISVKSPFQSGCALPWIWQI